MKTLLYNLRITLTRYRLASIINILGLTIAFAVFIIIMSKYKYENSINKSIKNHEDVYIFSMKMDMGEGLVDNGVISRGMARELRETSPLIESHTSIFLFMDENVNYNITNTDVSFIEKAYPVTPSIVDVLSLECVDGNFEQFNQPNTMIIPQSLAYKLFRDKTAIGKVLRREDAIGQAKGNYIDFTIVGVYKDIPNNSFGNKVLENLGDYQKNDLMSGWNYACVFKLKAGAKPSEAMGSMLPKIEELLKTNNVTSFDINDIVFIPVADLYFSDVMYFSFPKGNKSLLYILLAIAIIIVIIATINYTNFFMALVPVRIKTININKIFGAPTSALRANILFESVCIMAITFLLSLFLVEFASTTIVSELSESSIKVKDNLSIIALSFAIAIIVGVLSGLFPAWYITKFSPSMVLKGSFGRSKKGIILRQSLTSIQFSVSIILTILAAFIIIQNKYMQNYDYGYNRERLLITKISQNIATKNEIFSNAINSSSLFDGVSYSFQPITNSIMTWSGDFKNTSSSFKVAPVSWNFPEFMDMKIVDGRSFNELDYLKPEGAVIFNETAAREFGLQVGDDFEGHNVTTKIVGIVKDYNYLSLHSSVGPACLYLYGKENSWNYLTNAYIRLSPKANLKEAISYVEDLIKKSDPNISPELIRVTPLNKYAEAAYAKEEQIAHYIIIFSVISILISLLGVFGIIVFDMQYNRKEVAVRKVFGARLINILYVFNKKIINVLAISSVIAIPVGVYATKRWLEGFAYQTPIHWWVFALAILVIFAIVILVVNLQTYKTANENPTNNLNVN